MPGGSLLVPHAPEGAKIIDDDEDDDDTLHKTVQIAHTTFTAHVLSKQNVQGCTEKSAYHKCVAFIVCVQMSTTELYINHLQYFIKILSIYIGLG